MSKLDSLIPAPFKQPGPGPLDGLALAKYVGQPALRCVVTVGNLIGGARIYTLRVVNCKGDPCTGLFEIDVYVAASAGGPLLPVGSHTALWQTGTVLGTFAVRSGWVVVTTNAGVASVKVTAASGQQRVVHAAVKAVFDSSIPGVYP